MENMQIYSSLTVFNMEKKKSFVHFFLRGKKKPIKQHIVFSHLSHNSQKTLGTEFWLLSADILSMNAKQKDTICLYY